MTYMGAALWVTGIHIAFLWVASAVVTLRESASRDLVAQLICQIVAYSLGLFLMLRVHGPQTPIRRFVGMRATHPLLVALAALLGASVSIPAAVLFSFLDKRFPQEQVEFEFVDLFFQVTRGEQVLIAIGVIVIGPFVEELVFRGALFGPLRQDKSPVAVILITTAFFALVHLDPRKMLPIFLVGLLLGYLRHVSGSLIPSVALHAAFNAVPFVDLFRADSAAVTTEEMDVPRALLFGALGLCAVLLVCIHFLAMRSRLAQNARAQE
jgi:membrane protease YdiL (CAAX protease family)